MEQGRSLAELLAEAETAVRCGSSYAARTWPTGFTPLDAHLAGGLRAGELTLVSGPQAQGKTTFVLQLARNISKAGGHVLYVSYEHPEGDVLARLLAMEAGLLAGSAAFRLNDVRTALASAQPEPGGLEARLAALGDGVEATQSLSTYGDRLQIVGASGRPLPLGELVECALGRAEPTVVVVDYLQKVATGRADQAEGDQVTEVATRLKDLALRSGAPVVAIAAAESVGISTGRVRLHHLRGSSALAYEADVALMLNNKYAAVAKHHLAYSTTNVERFQKYVVCSIEKNRGGRDRIDLEFETHFDRGHLNPVGAVVVEQLIDDRLGGE